MERGDGEQSRVWVVRAGKAGRHALDFENLGLIAIGFKEAGDPTELSREQLLAQAREELGSRAGNAAGQVDRFARVMSKGDVVIVPDGSTRELLCGRVMGDFERHGDPPVAHFQNVRTVEWLARRDRDLLPDRVLFTLGSLLTVFKPAQQELLRVFALTGAVPPEAEDATADPAETGEDEAAESATSAADQAARNVELIAKRIAGLGPYETQDLAAGILEALGYTAEVAPPGADGGLDIRACKDPLFLQSPVIKAQVKARPGTKTSPDELRQLNGLLDRTHERGIFISTGGFTGPATAEATQMRIQLWDLPRITELFLESYPRLRGAVADLVSLRQIWVLDDPELDSEEE